MLKKYPSNDAHNFDVVLIENYAKNDKENLEKEYQIDPLLLELCR